MKSADATSPITDRVAGLLRTYGDANASASHLLCGRHDPARVAYTIVAQDLTSTTITYGELDDESGRLAGALVARGFGPGDRIATLMGKSRELLVTLQAIWRIGAVHVPLFTAFATAAIEMRLRASGCKAVFCDADQAPKLAGIDPSILIVTIGVDDANGAAFKDLMRPGAKPAVPVALGPNAPLIQIYTSGTTGTPKGVIVPSRALASFQGYMEFALCVQDDDVFWNAADPGWAYGLYFGIIVTFLTGANSILLQGGFSPSVCYGVLEAFGVTNFAAAPTVYRALRAAPVPVPEGLALRRASSAGEPLTPEVNEWAISHLGVRIHDHYGQTETGMTICNHHHPALKRELKTGSMGRSAPGWSVQVLETASDTIADAGEGGRVAIDLANSPFAWFEGYVDEPAKSAEKFSADGRWYFAGDLARRDDDGDFFFSSRDDDLIIMAGYRIGPFEVESALSGHPAIAECSVVGVPDEIRGEVLEAAVVLREGQMATEALTCELQGWVKKNYAAHAYPRRIHYMEALPKTPSGKVQRFVIRERICTSARDSG